MPENVQEEPQDDTEDTDEDTDAIETEERVHDQEYAPEVEEVPHVHVPEPKVPVSAPVEFAPMRTSGRVRNNPELLHITVKKGLQQHYGRAAAAGKQEVVRPSSSLEAIAGTAEESYQVIHVPEGELHSGRRVPEAQV